MMNSKTFPLIIFMAVVFGLLLGYRAGLPFGWQRALIAGLAFGLLGWLIGTLSARRK